MTSEGRENQAGWLIASLWAVEPLYPSFVALMPVTPPGFSLLSPLASAVLLAFVLLAILRVLVLLIADQAAKRLLDPLQRSIWLYAAVVTIISLCGVAPVFGLLYAFFVGSTGIGMTALLHWGRCPRFAARMRVAMLSSSGLAGLLAIVLWHLKWPALLYAVGNGRAIGCFVVPGELAGYMGMFLPFALGIALSSSACRERLFAWGVVGIDALAMFASLSRAGLLGLALGLALLVARWGRQWLGLYLCLVLGLVVVLSYYGFDVHHNPAEDTNRLAIWSAAVRVVFLFPLLGVGPGGFAHVYPLVRLPNGEPLALHAHSLLLSTLAETGLVGLWALVQMWGRFICEFRSAFRYASKAGQTLALAVAAGFVGTWIQSSIDVVQILVLGLWIPFMGIALLALEDRSPTAEVHP